MKFDSFQRTTYEGIEAIVLSLDEFVALLATSPLPSEDIGVFVSGSYGTGSHLAYDRLRASFPCFDIDQAGFYVDGVWTTDSSYLSDERYVFGTTPQLFECASEMRRNFPTLALCWMMCPGWLAKSSVSVTADQNKRPIDLDNSRFDEWSRFAALSDSEADEVLLRAMQDAFDLVEPEVPVIITHDDLTVTDRDATRMFSAREDVTTTVL